MTIKAVFFDMDGTLLTDQRGIRPSTIRAITALKKEGILVGLATGRGPQFLLSYMASLGIDVAIAYNGQYILSREEVLYANPLALQDLEDLLSYAKKHHQDISLGSATGVLGSQLMAVGTGSWAYAIARLIPKSWAGLVNFLLNRILRTFRPQKFDQIQGHLYQQPIYQVMLLATEIETLLLQKHFPTLRFTRSSPYSADVISQGTSKLEGIAKLADIYGFHPQQVMAFGDSANDLEMLEGVGIGVAMGNASRKVKLAANYVTTSNNQDGIAKALSHFGLIAAPPLSKDKNKKKKKRSS